MYNYSTSDRVNMVMSDLTDISVNLCHISVHYSQNLIQNATRTPRPKIGADMTHLPAPACIFSNGLPLPLYGRSVACAGSVEVDGKESVGLVLPGVGLGRERSGLELVLLSKVVVIMSPVLIPVGPMTMGMIT